MMGQKKNREFHKPVLLKEIISALQVKKGQKYIDATIGGGGHAKRILELGGLVLGVDVDQEAIDYVKQELASYIEAKRLLLVRANFKDIAEIANKYEFNRANGVLFDLGLSSWQIDNESRGFSFLKEGPLDMRMDKSLSVKASDLINGLTKGELYELFSKLGQEHHANAIAHNIVKSRGIKPIETTGDLVTIIARSYGLRSAYIRDYVKANISQKVFQSLRIAVNDELNNLKIALGKALEILGDKGKILVISFHSLEDKIVKDYFVGLKKKGLGNLLTSRPIRASKEEFISNRRSRSAGLRIFEKL